MIYGMGFGEGLIVYILSSGMKGTSRQLSLFKVYEAYLASAIMLILFAIEFTTHIPLFFDLISYLGSTIEQQTAYSFFAVKIVPVVIMTFFYGSIYKMLVKISPPLHEENLSKLQFINEHSLRDVETALTLVESEQERIIRRFPMYIENIMQDANNKNLTDLNLLHKSTLPLLDELDNFLKNVINMNLSHQTSERFINIQNRQNQIRSIELSLFSFADTIRLTNIQGSVNQLIENLVQALHANISLVADAAKSHDEFDLMMVINATNDRGDLMERIRKQYLSLDSDIQAEDKPLLLYITDLFQRIIWLSNKWATLQKAAISN
jgi:Na+/phosphate symporter